MARGLRVLFEPLERAGGLVVGGRLSLAPLGKGATKAKRGESVAAKLTFTAVALAAARGKELGSRVLGAMLGELELSTTGTDPVLTIQRDSSTDLLDAAAAPGDRKLRLALSEPTLRLVTTSFDPTLRVVVPSDLLTGARHLELRVKLELAGSVEGSDDVNDVLDVPLVPRPVVLVQIVDEVGEPISGVPLELEGGSELEVGKTDARGRFQIDDLGLTNLSVTVTDAEALRAEMKSRWAKPRVGALLVEADETQVRFLSDVTTPIELGQLTTLRLSVQPRVSLARLLGLVFESNKSFVLPAALADLKELKSLNDEHPDSEVLVVGHTDTTADPATNDPLSLERAESVVAYLEQDIETWLGRYDEKTPKKRRWGANEDSLMVASLPPNGPTTEPDSEDDDDEVAADPTEDPISRFQRTRGLKVDGHAGPQTRRRLITEYFARDEEILPAGTALTAHGAGEFFPVDTSGEELDGTPADGKRDASDRRVEIYFFEKEFGILPPPPSKSSKAGSREYPEWRRRARLSREADLRFSNRVLKLRLQQNDKDLGDEEYSVDVDERRLAVARTDAQGFLEQRLPIGAKMAVVRLPRVNLIRSFLLVPSESFPAADELRGAQSRLMQLGFLPKEADGKFDNLTASAVRSFRVSQGLSDEAVLDDDTATALTKAFGS